MSTNSKRNVIDLLAGSHATTGEYGLSDLANDDELLAQVYTDAAGYTAERRAQIKAKLQKNPPTVRGAYPDDWAQFPCVFVMRTGDSEQTPNIMGQSLGERVELSNDRESVVGRGVLMSETLAIGIWTTLWDWRDDLYLAVRFLLLRGRAYLEARGMIDTTWRNGQDGQRPDPQPKSSLVIYEATATLAFGSELSWFDRRERQLQFDGRLQGYGGNARPMTWRNGENK